MFWNFGSHCPVSTTLTAIHVVCDCLGKRRNQNQTFLMHVLVPAVDYLLFQYNTVFFLYCLWLLVTFLWLLCFDATISTFYAGDTLLVGTRQGHLLVYSVRPNHGLPDRPFDTALERSNKSFAKKPIMQLEVVPEYHIVVSISGICICIFYFFYRCLSIVSHFCRFA